jgi:signal transduction histidine kinase
MPTNQKITATDLQAEKELLPLVPQNTNARINVLESILTSTGKGLLSFQDSALAAADAAVLMAELFGLSHTMVLRPVPANDALLLQGGVGWTRGMVGHAVFAMDKNTLIDAALATAEPVLSEDLRVESRFSLPVQLHDAGFVCGISLRFPYHDQTFGILAGFSTQPRFFNEQDIFCLRLVASLLVASISSQRMDKIRDEDQEKITQAKLEWEATVDALPHFICLLDDQFRIMRANRSAEQWVSGQIQDVRGHTLHDLLHPGCNDPGCYMPAFTALAWIDLLGGRPVEYEVEDRVLNRYLGIHLRQTTRQVAGDRKHTSFAVVVLHDISFVKQAEEVLKSYNEQLEKRIQSRTAELMQTNKKLMCEIEERLRVEETLRYSENEMRLMSEQLLTAQEMERKRIAAELHDGIGQSLTAIKFSMENAIGLRAADSSVQETERSDKIITMLRGAIEEVRKISMDLHPSTLTDLGIIPTIAWFCREFRSIYSGIRLVTYIDLEEDNVPMPLKTVIFRIMQEALNNIVKHAKADSVHVHLRKTGVVVELLIEDNGVGFDVNALAQRNVSDKGFGITGMRERAEFSGGAFVLRSIINTGTVVHVSWPSQD